MNVSVRGVRRAKAVQKKGVPELVDAVAKGEASAAAAEKVAALPEDRQHEVMSEVARHPDKKQALSRVVKQFEEEPEVAANTTSASAPAATVADSERKKYGAIYADPNWEPDGETGRLELATWSGA